VATLGRATSWRFFAGTVVRCTVEEIGDVGDISRVFRQSATAQMVLGGSTGSKSRRGIRVGSYSHRATEFRYCVKVPRWRGERTLGGEGVEGLDDKGGEFSWRAGRVGSEKDSPFTGVEELTAGNAPAQ